VVDAAPVLEDVLPPTPVLDELASVVLPPIDEGLPPPDEELLVDCVAMTEVPVDVPPFVARPAAPELVVTPPVSLPPVEDASVEEPPPQPAAIPRTASATRAEGWARCAKIIRFRVQLPDGA
jgi:hypothetical protein